MELRFSTMTGGCEEALVNCWSFVTILDAVFSEH